MRTLFVICVFFFAATAMQAQQSQHPSKKAYDLYTAGLQKATDGDLPGGIELLQQSLRLEPNFASALLSIAGMYAQKKDYASSVDYYEKCRAVDSVYFRDYTLPYSISMAALGEFDKALQAVNRFLAIPDLNASSRRAGEYRKQCYEFALAFQRKTATSPYRFEPHNLGDSINSDVSEYFPALTIDQGHLYFTRRVNNANEDFYESEQQDHHWSKSRSLPGSINTASNEGAQNVSQDGRWLIFTGCNFPDGRGSCDLYLSELTPNGWSQPQNLGNSVNTEAWESAPSLSPDKHDLYFASNRAGGYGNSDIYVSHLMPDGNWSEPENAGPQINTSGNESCPFIHADNQTLYFTSDGHPGYGGDDLFVARKKNGKWEEPANLGYPINTIENEGSLVVSADGGTAYYASDRSDSRGGLDLYSFELPIDARPAKTLWVRGRVFDAKTMKALPSAIELTDLASQTRVSLVQTDETGEYLTTLPVGHDYAFNVGRKGYLLYSENFSLSDTVTDSTFLVDIPLQPLEDDATVILKNIFFDVNRYELKPSSSVELNKVAKLLLDNPRLTVLIKGYTDNVGKAEDNLRLSTNRAKAVTEYLVKAGIERGRLAFKGYGASNPVADNAAASGRAMNRRTEMTVVHQMKPSP